MTSPQISPSSMTANPGPPAGPPSGGPGPVTPNANSSKKKSGCGCTGMVLGCGCLTVMLMMAVGVIGSFVVLWQAPRAVGADDWGEVVSLAESAKQAADGAGQSIGGAGGLAGGLGGEDLSSLDSFSAEEPGETGVDQFFNVLDTPTSSRDMRRFQSNMDDWEDSDAVKEFQDVLERAQELEDQEESLMVGFQTLRLLTQFAFRSNDLGEAYANHGDDDFYHLHSRVLAVARASQIAAANEHDPWTQEVADALIEDHDENREEYEQTRQLVQQATMSEGFDPDSLSEEEQMELMEAMGNQFLFITSAINRDSLETWAGLSDEERKGIIEQSNEPHNFIARALSLAHVDHEDDELYVFPFLGF